MAKGGKKKWLAEKADESEEEASELEDEGGVSNRTAMMTSGPSSTVAEWRSIGKP